MLTFLAGGTGTPKLLWGTDPVFDPGTVTVVANTGDDVELGGLLVCPDVDSVIYGRADRLDRKRWWGQAGDTSRTNEALGSIAESLDRTNPRYLSADAQTSGPEIARWRRFSAVPEFLHIGDKDRALHLARASLLAEGHTLTAVTRRLGTALGLTVDVRPMSDDPVASIVHTPDGPIHFQEFWVSREGEPAVETVEFRGADRAAPTDAVLDALRHPVVIGPANPITSLGPMLALDGVEAALEATTVVAVSPFVEDRVFSGPAAKLMNAMGYDPSTAGVARALPFVDAFVLDTADGTDLDVPTVRTETAIEERADATRVARAVRTALEAV